MALARDRNNCNDSGEKVANESGHKKGRHYAYIGIAFSLFTILATAYLAMVIFSGSFVAFDGFDDITNYFPFYDTAHNEAEFQGYSGRDIILVCCSWGEELADGEITYFIGDQIIDESSNGNRYEVDEEWDSKIEGLKFTESPTRRGADVEVYFREGQNEKAGITNNYYDFYGFITKSYVQISRGAFGFAFSSNQMEQIVKHEIGHALGLGHANFDGNLMAAQVNRGIGSVSSCETEAVYAANEWWFDKPIVTQPLYMRQPTTDHIECK
jgi:flagellin-like hook-associated protein FlgL